jgi:hypothetical protein
MVNTAHLIAQKENHDLAGFAIAIAKKKKGKP